MLTLCVIMLWRGAGARVCGDKPAESPGAAHQVKSSSSAALFICECSNERVGSAQAARAAGITGYVTAVRSRFRSRSFPVAPQDELPLRERNAARIAKTTADFEKDSTCLSH